MGLWWCTYRKSYKKFIEFEKKNNLTSGTLVKINSHNKMNNAWAKLEKDLMNEKEFAELF